MKRILLASVAALVLAGTASAADMAVKAPVVYAPVFTWTGCYVGINGGWIGSDQDVTSHADDSFGGFTPAERLASTNTFSPDGSGGTAGGQFGCQWQWGSVVLGGEWDWNWSGLEEDNVYRITDPIFAPDVINQSTHTQLDWFMTARARLGWAAWDRFMIYATGGLAVGAYDSYTSVDFVPGNVANGAEHFGSYREKRIGYAVGGGFEWAFANNWSAKAEFLYLDFDTFDYRAFETTTRVWKTEIDAQEYVVRVGLNYLFHLGGPPVAARF